MSETCWLFDKLCKHILESIEISRSLTFRESDLVRVSPESLLRLQEIGFLQKHHRDLNSTFVADDGERYRITKVKEDLIGWPLSPESSGTITLSVDQRAFYQANIESLVEAVRKLNKLAGKPVDSDQRLVFVGETRSGKEVLRVCLGFFDSDSQAKSELFSAGSRYGIKGRVLVICPTYEPPADLFAELDSRDIACVNFHQAFRNDSFEIDFSVARRDKITDVELVSPMTVEEEAAKRKYGYKGWDVLSFLNERARYGSYFIEISGKKEKIPAALMLLLIYFAQRLMKDKQGWVSREEAAELKIIDPYNDNHYDDLVHKLRNKIGPHLQTCNRDEFIETNNKRFRISILPGRVVVPSNSWLSDTFEEIKETLLNKRRKKGEQWK